MPTFAEENHKYKSCPKKSTGSYYKQINMKKLVFMLVLCFSVIAQAKDKKDDSKYMAGAVPEQNGVVTFSKTFKVPGKSKQEIYKVLKAWAEGLVENSIEAPGNFARISMDTPDTIVAKVCEFQVYKDKFLNLDRSRFRYNLSICIDGNKVSINQYGLVYYYGEDTEGKNGKIYRAEEWINDANALNKAKTKLLPQSGKFRRKTVDRATELFESAMDAFEEPQKVETAPVKKVRKGVEE